MCLSISHCARGFQLFSLWLKTIPKEGITTSLDNQRRWGPEKLRNSFSHYRLPQVARGQDHSWSCYRGHLQIWWEIHRVNVMAGPALEHRFRPFRYNPAVGSFRRAVWRAILISKCFFLFRLIYKTTLQLLLFMFKILLVRMDITESIGLPQKVQAGFCLLTILYTEALFSFKKNHFECLWKLSILIQVWIVILIAPFTFYFPDIILFPGTIPNLHNANPCLHDFPDNFIY